MMRRPGLVSDSKLPAENQPRLAETGNGPGQLSRFVAFNCYLLCCVMFILVISRVRNFWEMSRHYGDNQGYLAIAQAAREGRFSGPDLQDARRLYRGTGYCVALASKLTSLPVTRCLPLLSLLCGALAVYFCGRLWGWRVAALFSFIDVAYTGRVCLGGCEPFFILFLLASLWLWRKQHALGAMACAALATTIRPTGILLIGALAAVLIGHRRWRDSLRAALVVTAIGALYFAPVVFAAKDTMAPATGYADDWYGPSPISVPFYPLLYGAATCGCPWTFHLKVGFYVLLTLFGVATLWKRRGEAFANPVAQVESLFFLLFAAFCVSYNSNWAYEEYPRYSSPLIPQSVLGLRSRLLTPWVVLCLSVVAGMLSAGSALNVREVFHMFVR